MQNIPHFEIFLNIWQSIHTKPNTKPACIVEYFDARLEVDVLEHVVDFDVASSERRSSGRHSDLVDTRRGAEHQSDTDRYRGEVHSLRASDACLAARHVLGAYRERRIGHHVLRSDENVLTVALDEKKSPSHTLTTYIT